MKKLIVLLLFFFKVFINAQVGIKTTHPNQF